MTTPDSALVTPAVLPPGFEDPGIPRIAVEPVESCPLCSSRGWNPFADGYDYELRTCRNRWHFVACAQCDHVRLHPRPRSDTLGVIYPPTYYAYNYDTQVSPLALKAKAWLDRRKFAGILRHLPRPPSSYLDVGCGNGRFLDLMAGQGVTTSRIYGIELDQPTVDRLRARGYQAWCERAEECKELPTAGIDLATMFHVIEHVGQPLAVVTRLAECLTAGGILALETPNLDSWDARLFKDHFWGGYHIPRHWHLFTPRTITRLLNKAGLDVLAIEFQTGHSFWMYSFHHRLRYGTPPRPRLAAHFNPMGGSLLALAAVTAFDKARAALGASTSAMLVIARKPE
jgi:SAM-dependent methyltransferase